ncbi:MAG: hypothetical protein NVSMB42_21640 [Herpetosiphon sp.]
MTDHEIDAALNRMMPIIETAAHCDGPKYGYFWRCLTAGAAELYRLELDS